MTEQKKLKPKKKPDPQIAFTHIFSHLEGERKPISEDFPQIKEEKRCKSMSEAKDAER